MDMTRILLPDVSHKSKGLGHMASPKAMQPVLPYLYMRQAGSNITILVSSVAHC